MLIGGTSATVPTSSKILHTPLLRYPMAFFAENRQMLSRMAARYYDNGVERNQRIAGQNKNVGRPTKGRPEIRGKSLELRDIFNLSIKKYKGPL
jgi:hypothetical protein